MNQSGKLHCPKNSGSISGSMRFGINTFLFASPFTNVSAKLFPRFKKWGFDSVEIPIEDPAHIDPVFIKAELNRHGLVCGAATPCLSPDCDLRGTSQQQKSAIEFMRRAFEKL